MVDEDHARAPQPFIRIEHASASALSTLRTAFVTASRAPSARIDLGRGFEGSKQAGILVDDRLGELVGVSGPFGGHDTTMIENTSLSG
jgi:hypothetical protein